jgi:hypothetical protein
MRTEPDFADLITIARETLKTEVLPHLPLERRYAARMTLNALAIARRQIAGGAARRAAAIALLRPFARGDDLDTINRALAERLRAGDAGPDPASLHAALVEVARAETEESHPRARILRE